MTGLQIRMEETPNPNSKRYVLNRPVQESPKGRFFTEPPEEGEPLVRILLALEGVKGVMLLPNSVTVNKDAAAGWDDLASEAEEAIKSYFAGQTASPSQAG